MPASWMPQPALRSQSTRDVHTEHSFGGHTLELAQVFEDILVPLGRPAVYGLPLGHGQRLATVPLGVEVELDADEGTLRVIEPWFA